MEGEVNLDWSIHSRIYTGIISHLLQLWGASAFMFIKMSASDNTGNNCMRKRDVYLRRLQKFVGYRLGSVRCKEWLLVYGPAGSGPFLTPAHYNCQTTQASWTLPHATLKIHNIQPHEYTNLQNYIWRKHHSNIN